MFNEELFIENLFRKHFSPSDKLVIYGLGKNTKVILDRCNDYSIIGLMDRIRTGETEWGLPILSIEEVAALGVKKIVILATAANVPIIFRRIQGKCEEYGIEVYDINGERKENKSKEYKLDDFYNVSTWDALVKKIDAADVVSFDIFDTLLVRDVLYPTDIFDVMADKYKDLVHHFDFSKLRINSEMSLYKKCNPTVFEIYETMKDETGLSDDVINYLCKKEIEEEFASLSARKRMLDAVNYALSLGKIVCCTSDMYLTSDILRELLKKEGYSRIADIFVSCEYGVTKSSGLFTIVKDKFRDKRILHIGDNYDADVVAASRFGIADTFQIASPYKMACDSRLERLLAHDTSIENRCELGKLFSHLFNNPFLFQKTEGKCVIDDNFCLGYYYIEPLIASFVAWMLERCISDDVEMLLLGARDGLIMRDILDLRRRYFVDNIDYMYFYASRFACTLAGVNSEEDVRYAFRMAFEGSEEELLMRRFELSRSDLLDRMSDELPEEYLERHIPMILDRASLYRNRYRFYIEKANMDVQKVAFFDFVSSGTCQLWLENIYPEVYWKGLYFIKNMDPYKEKLDIDSFYIPKCVYEKQSKLYKNYIFMENIMTSYEPTLHGFAKDGERIFEAETRSEEQIDKVKEIHYGILKAYEARITGRNMVATRELVDDILDLLNGEYSIMKANFFDKNVLDDSFCNRSFELAKMVAE